MTIFAHQDDETFSAGGILAKYGQSGNAFAVSVTSDSKRADEFQKACEILGIEPITLENKKISPENEVSIKNQLIRLIQTKQPTYIITHTDFDYHYEHRKVREIVEEAVEWASHTTSNAQPHQISSLWAAETTVLIPFPELYIDISSVNNSRLKAIGEYESQSHKGGEGFYSNFHNTRTKLRGIQAGVEHAEAFLQIPIAQAGSFKPTKVFDMLPY